MLVQTVQAAADFTLLPISPATVIVTQSFTNEDDPFFAQTIHLTAQPLSGYNNTVTLSCSVSPPLSGGSCVVNAPSSGSLASSSLTTTLTISAGVSTPLGSYTVTVTGQDNSGLEHSTTMSLTVINYATGISEASGGAGRTTVSFGGPAGAPITNFSCPLVSGTGVAGSQNLSTIGGVCAFDPIVHDFARSHHGYDFRLHGRQTTDAHAGVRIIFPWFTGFCIAGRAAGRQ